MRSLPWAPRPRLIPKKILAPKREGESFAPNNFLQISNIRKIITKLKTSKTGLKFFSGIYDRGILWVSSGIIRENEIIGRRISEYSDQSISSLFSAKIVSLKVLCGYARDHRAGRCAHRRTPSLAPEHPHDAGACVCTLIAMFSGLSSMANRTPQTASLCTRDLGFLRL